MQPIVLTICASGFFSGLPENSDLKYGQSIAMSPVLQVVEVLVVLESPLAVVGGAGG